MKTNKLRNLLANNARKGEFRAEGNTLYLYDVLVSSKADAEWLGGVDAETFVQALKGMSGDVSLRINSPGGDVFAARAMAQAIRDHDGKVTAYVDGYAASAATFITSVADETLVAPGGMLMIHKAWSLAYGNSDDMMALAELLEKIDGTIAETYEAASKRRGKKYDNFLELMAAETWLTGAEAVEMGLADAVLEDAPKVSARWDLSAYDNAPVIEAAEDPPIEEIEQPRPNFAADMLLRPAV